MNIEAKPVIDDNEVWTFFAPFTSVDMLHEHIKTPEEWNAWRARSLELLRERAESLAQQCFDAGREYERRNPVK